MDSKIYYISEENFCKDSNTSSYHPFMKTCFKSFEETEQFLLFCFSMSGLEFEKIFVADEGTYYYETSHDSFPEKSSELGKTRCYSIEELTMSGGVV